MTRSVVLFLTVAALHVVADSNTPPCPVPLTTNIPQCTRANAEAIPTGNATHPVSLKRVDSPNNKVIFNDGSNGGLRLIASPSGNKLQPTNVELFAGGSAADRYRIFLVRSDDDTAMIWLTGNGKGAGSNCQINVNMDFSKFSETDQFVYEWGNVPANHCH